MSIENLVKKLQNIMMLSILPVSYKFLDGIVGDITTMYVHLLPCMLLTTLSMPKKSCIYIKKRSIGRFQSNVYKEITGYSRCC